MSLFSNDGARIRELEQSVRSLNDAIRSNMQAIEDLITMVENLNVAVFKTQRVKRT